MGDPGHNSGIAADQLRSYVERIERLEEEKKALTADIREVYAEAKSAGFEPKIMRKVVRERAMQDADRQEEQHLLDLYRHALGMLADTPLGEAAVGSMFNDDGSLKKRVGEKLEEAGFVHEGGNRWRAPTASQEAAE